MQLLENSLSLWYRFRGQDRKEHENIFTKMTINANGIATTEELKNGKYAIVMAFERNEGEMLLWFGAEVVMPREEIVLNYSNADYIPKPTE